jgi:hypothetical protein
VSAQISYEHPEHDAEHDDPIPDAVWYRVDGTNGRWLYVDQPSERLGGVPVGVQDVCRKILSSAEARAMAAALARAADEWDVLDARAKAERERFLEGVRICEELGGHEWPDPGSVRRSGFVCRRCGSAPRTTAHVLATGP